MEKKKKKNLLSSVFRMSLKVLEKLKDRERTAKERAGERERGRHRETQREKGWYSHALMRMHMPTHTHTYQSVLCFKASI